jgi:hypothetical protein
MKTLQIDETNAKKFYKNADPAFKQALIDTFSENFFSEKITDRVKTFEDACKVLKIDYHSFQLAAMLDSPDVIAYQKLKIIARALNEGWTPDWDNQSQYKYYPWFDMRGSGLVFSHVTYWCQDSIVGSRLCFRSRELAEYAGTQFTDIYRAFLK